MNRAERRACGHRRRVPIQLGCTDCDAWTYLVYGSDGHPHHVDVEHDDSCPVYRGRLPCPPLALLYVPPTPTQEPTP